MDKRIFYILGAALIVTAFGAYAHGPGMAFWDSGYPDSDYMEQMHDEYMTQGLDPQLEEQMDQMHEYMTQGLDSQLKDQMDEMHEDCMGSLYDEG